MLHHIVNLGILVGLVAATKHILSSNGTTPEIFKGGTPPVSMFHYLRLYVG